jgi:hypothetical protein
VTSGFRTFTAGEVLTASNVQNYLMDQSVMTFAGSAARSSAIGTANFEEGMTSYLKDTDKLEIYNGTNWVSVAPTTTQGLTLINTTSFSGVSSQSFSSIFDKTLYNFWRVEFRLHGSVSTNTRIRGRANTTDISSGVYGASYYADYGGSAAVFSSSNNAAQMTITAHSNTSSSLAYINADVSLADDNNFHWTGNAWSGDGAKAHFFGFNVGGAGANGFSIIPTSGTITGTCSIFAYNK